MEKSYIAKASGAPIAFPNIGGSGGGEGGMLIMGGVGGGDGIGIGVKVGVDGHVVTLGDADGDIHASITNDTAVGWAFSCAYDVVLPLSHRTVAFANGRRTYGGPTGLSRTVPTA